jgi:hypothetical protein
MTPGEHLRTLREALSLTLKDVESASALLAQERGNSDFAIPASRLSEIEVRGLTPSIFRVYSLAAIYRQDFRELLRLYGVDVDCLTCDAAVARPRNTHIVRTHSALKRVQMPTALDPGLDPARTTSLARWIEQWGSVPMSLLARLTKTDYLYGYVGADDWTMWPLVMPGSFIQVDRSRSRVQSGPWISEHVRPIYFVELRDEFVCCWCDLKETTLALISHPLSPVPIRQVRHRHDALIIGKVVGIAQQLTGATPYAREMELVAANVAR